MISLLEKLNEIAIIDDSWMKKFEYDIENERWLKISGQISLKILTYLRENGLNKYSMIDSLDISAELCDKIVKGSYNFDIDLITKIEETFKINLIKIL